MSLDDTQLLRYSRHILLPELDITGQEALQNSHVLIIGIGGLGNPAAQYLAASGVGHLTLADGDKVELSNLQRQILFKDSDIGNNKAETAKSVLIHHGITIDTIDHFLNDEELNQVIQKVDVILDCTDNFNTRSAINQYCVQHKKVLVSGAAIQWHGQIAVYDFRHPNSPCYQCLYRSLGETDLGCNENGIAAPVVGIIGSAQALEALKVIAQVDKPITNQLLLFNGLEHQWRSFKINQDPQCSVCG